MRMYDLKGRWYIIKLRKIKEKEQSYLSLSLNQLSNSYISFRKLRLSSAQVKYIRSFTSLACNTKGNTHGSILFIIIYSLFNTKILLKSIF